MIIVVNMKKVGLFLVYLVSFIYMEFLYKFFIYNNYFRISLLNMFLFLIVFSLILTVLTKLFENEKNNKLVYIVIMGIISIWFCAEYVCKSYFDFYISLSTFEVADQLGEFMGKTILEIAKRIPGILLFFTPLILTLLFNKKIDFRHNSFKKAIGLVCVALCTYAIYLGSLNVGKSKESSSYELYHNVNDFSLDMENFGVLNSIIIHCVNNKLT